MVIIMLIISLLGTFAAIGCTTYAVYITSHVSGEKLLTLNSELGYRYATTYRDWQGYAAISVIAAVVLWIIFIFILVKKHKKRRKKQMEAVKFETK